MISVVDCGMGNVGSVVNMLRHIGEDAELASTADQIANSDKLILPGVGSFDHGVQLLRRGGISDALNIAVLERRVPILGICLGMQLFCRGSEEGNLPGLGWISADVVRFRQSPESEIKIPNMGWNVIDTGTLDVLFQKMSQGARFYFVHSYHVICDDIKDVCAWTEYGYRFASAVRSKNIWGTQFHPEKSHKFGMQVLSNFAALARP
ncbi:imidazole glycerol phosphate synthase subunit HisH [soil metagenome]